MKYVRTKDGKIFSFYKIVKYDFINSFVIDGFVYEENGFCHFLSTDDLNYAQAKQLKIYGAIWTKLGLDFVATLNEEGKWELL